MAGEARRQAARIGLDADATEDVVQEVALAACTVGRFRSASAAERYAGVVAHRAAKAAQRADRRNGVAVGLAFGPPEDYSSDSSEGVDGPDFRSVLDSRAPRADDPEHRAVLKVGARAELAALTDTERRALGYPLGPMASTRAEQNLWALRLMRARQRVGEGVRDLLMPAAIGLTVRLRRLQARLIEDPVPALASLAGALTGAALGSLGTSGAAVAEHAPPRTPTLAAVARPLASANASVSPGLGAVTASSPPSRPPTPTGSTRGAGSGRPGPAAIEASGGVQRSSDYVAGNWSLTLSSEDQWRRDTFHMTVYCDSDVRRKLCAALPPPPGSSGPSPPAGP
jgi:hypothetical protein